ncbi:TrbI/VirB10 family protein [Methylobacter sp.]|uniref:TrbI/VirB10 family protein n=1 Tax=Methylobacter sp. TaxID=2051955 RepID=UPI003DA2EAEF
MAGEIDNMAPDASPGAGVRRVNNLPMYIIGGVVAAFLFMMALVAADRAAKQNEGEDPHQSAGNTSMFAKEIAGDQVTGMIEPLKPPAEPDIPKLDPVLIARPDNPDMPPRPPAEQLAPHDEEADRIRQAKLQMFEEAVKAKTGVQVVAPRSSGSAISTDTPKTREEMLVRLAAVRQQLADNDAQKEDPTTAFKRRLAFIRSIGPGGGTTSGSSTPSLLQTSTDDADTTAGGSGNSYSQFAGGEGDRWELGSKTEAPRSQYELRAGFVVPATLISGINSDLPGQIMAQVAQNVYDTPIGKYLLIPQGSRLVGTYSSDVAYGQARVLVAWQRIVFPDGKALDIGAMPGGDSAGYAGFNDLENHHYFRLFGSALLMSAVTAATSYSQRQDQGTVFGRQDAGTALSEALGQQLGQVTAQLIAKNMNIAPTLEIRPGYRFNVIVTKDMTFSKPYQSFDY